MRKSQYRLLLKLLNLKQSSASNVIGYSISKYFPKTKKSDINYLVHKKYIEYQNHIYDTCINLTNEGKVYILEEENKDWLIKATEWFKLRNIIGYIITTLISLIAIALSIFSLIKSYSK